MTGLPSHAHTPLPYFDPAWMKVLHDVHDIPDASAEYAGHRLPLGLIKSPIFGNRLISTPFADYGGPAGMDEQTGAQVAERLVQSTVGIAQSLKLDYVEIRSPAFGPLFEKHGFVSRTDYCTFQLDLSVGPAALWPNLEKRTRNGITHGQKEGLHFHRADVSNAAHALRAFYGLYTKTMKSIGSPPQPKKFFDALWQAFGPQRIRLEWAEKNGRELAAVLVYLGQSASEKIAHYAYSCSEPSERKARASDALLWHAVESLSKEGIATFDFGRTRPDSGVYAYKQGWGGKERPLPYYYKFFGSKLQQRDEVKYAKLAQLWRDHVPKSVADRLGPWIIKQIG